MKINIDQLAALLHAARFDSFSAGCAMEKLFERMFSEDIFIKILEAEARLGYTEPSIEITL